jgi:hypothetical protein
MRASVKNVAKARFLYILSIFGAGTAGLWTTLWWPTNLRRGRNLKFNERRSAFF